MQSGIEMSTDEDDGSDQAGDTETFDCDARKAIMEATYRALCAHGAADLSVQDIADKFEKSKSLIFYHYDSKEELLTSFLVYLLDGFEKRVATTDDKEPIEQLDTLIDALLFGPEDHEEFQTAMLELRSKAPYNEAYREQFRTNSEYIHGLFEAVIERGIEREEFADVDPSRIATMLLTTIDGARTRFVVHGDEESLDAAREVIDDQLDRTLFAGIESERLSGTRMP
ncbi:TetR family transcriptional regulator [Halococcus thailandensis JCM 13552]|uniref:TetR family transcriptional regulator n=2 Tax=Halococcus thailandensis TaxID=335952 RepID=M0NE50_9EURY|nr:TetR family transcriptional regulator [Halococcus thailandensis JCM 13552]